MEHRCHRRYQGIRFPQSSIKGGEAEDEPFPYRSLFTFDIQRGINPFFLFGQPKKLDELEDQPKNKNDESNRNQRSTNKIRHEPLPYPLNINTQEGGWVC